VRHRAHGPRPLILAGQAACLSAAFLWALSVALFRGAIDLHGARSVNLAKCLLAAVLQGLTVVALGQADSLWTAPTRGLALIAVSGLVGLTLGDTALFAAVARIGVHRTLLLQTLAPVFAALLATAWLAERIAALEASGALTVLAGVALVVAPAGRGASPAPARQTGGIALAVLAAFGQGTGVVLAKQGMSGVPVPAASFLRLGTAAAGLLLLAASAGRLRRLSALVRDRVSMARVVPATLMGTYLALFLMMAGVALAPASVAAVLLATSPVFSLVLESAIERRLPPLRGAAGTLLAVAGVALLAWNQG